MMAKDKPVAHGGQAVIEGVMMKKTIVRPRANAIIIARSLLESSTSSPSANWLAE
jgi:uncharacterized protein YqhQ